MAISLTVAEFPHLSYLLPVIQRSTIIVSLCALAFAACTREVQVSSPVGKTVAFTVEVSDSIKERAKGLSGRSSVGQDEAMLFVFPKMDVHSFWMKNTKVPLDLMFFDDQGMFVSGHTMEVCKESIDKCPQYTSQSQALYAIEVAKGIREKKGIGVGWKLETVGLPRAED